MLKFVAVSTGFRFERTNIVGYYENAREDDKNSRTSDLDRTKQDSSPDNIDLAEEIPNFDILPLQKMENIIFRNFSARVCRSL